MNLSKLAQGVQGGVHKIGTAVQGGAHKAAGAAGAAKDKTTQFVTSSSASQATRMGFLGSSLVQNEQKLQREIDPLFKGVIGQAGIKRVGTAYIPVTLPSGVQVSLEKAQIDQILANQAQKQPTHLTFTQGADKFVCDVFGQRPENGKEMRYVSKLVRQTEGGETEKVMAVFSPKTKRISTVAVDTAGQSTTLKMTGSKDGGIFYDGVTSDVKKKGLVSKIKDGLGFAKRAYKNGDFASVEKVVESFKADQAKAQQFFATNTEFHQYLEKRGTIALFGELQALKAANAPDEKIIETYKKMIESLGTGPTKYAQNISGDEAKLTRFAQMITDKSGGQIPEKDIELLKEAIRQTKTNCSFTRSPEKAAEEIQSMFGHMGITGVERLSAASVGETYKGVTADGKQVVIKMIKDGVTPESLDEEMAMIETIARAIQTDGSASQTEKALKRLRNVYGSFHEELSFVSEATANKHLHDSLGRSDVAAVRAISNKGNALVMDMAEGVQANKLFPVLQLYADDSKFQASVKEMIAKYNANPEAFSPEAYKGDLRTYAKLLKQCPTLLTDPVKTMTELPKSLTGSFSEQMMFLKKVGDSTGAIMHGDPHTGNFFVKADPTTGLPKIVYIDTGNVVRSDSDQIIKNLKFFLSYFTGNSQEMSEYLVNSCSDITNNKGLSRSELIKYIAEQIEHEVYKFDEGGQRITDFGKVYGSMQTIVENLGMSMSPDIANYQKAQGMFLDAITTTNRFTGQSFDMGLLMHDIVPAMQSMKQNGAKPSSLVKMVVSHFAHNPEQAVGTIGQFRLNSIDKKKALDAALAELQAEGGQEKTVGVLGKLKDKALGARDAVVSKFSK